MKRNKGFTLIELLVVIAIIGILSAIVLASLNQARSKANDARIQSQVSSMRAAAEIYYSNFSNYGTLPAKSAVVLNSTTPPTAGTVGMFADPTSGMSGLVSSTAQMTTLVVNTDAGSNPATAWAAWAQLSGTGNYWCADSAGASKKEPSIPAAVATTVACP